MPEISRFYGIQNLPGYRALRTIHGLFRQVQVDDSRTCIFWNDELDLPSDIIKSAVKPRPLGLGI